MKNTITIGIKKSGPAYSPFGGGVYLALGRNWRLSIFEGGNKWMPGLVIDRGVIDVRFLANAVMYQWKYGFKVRLLLGEWIS